MYLLMKVTPTAEREVLENGFTFTDMDDLFWELLDRIDRVYSATNERTEREELELWGVAFESPFGMNVYSL